MQKGNAMANAKLPSWAHDAPKGYIEVKPSEVYPLFLERLGYSRNDLTQSQLEVARLCFTEELALAVGGSIKLRILKDPTYALNQWPVGDPINWRVEFNRINPPKTKQL